jgi:calmodulin-binding transcription activator
MSKELGEVDDSQITSSSGVNWNSEDAGNIIEATSCDQLDQFTVGPMLAQDQLFSIFDFVPSWTYAGSKTRVCHLKVFTCLLLGARKSLKMRSN